MLKITDTGAKVYGNGPLEYFTEFMFHVSKSKTR